MGVKKAVNKNIKIADKALQFIQESFNADDNLEGIITSLKANKSPQAKDLVTRQSDVNILKGDNLLNQVEDITSKLNLGGRNITVMGLTDKLIYNLNKSKGWLEDYKKFISSIKPTDTQNQLASIGVAILGRAVELCPIDTGFLRKSGLVIVNGNSVVIGFYAPYSIYVHENMNSRHITGQSKFLEQAVQEFFPNRSSWVDILGSDTLAIKISATFDITYTHYEN